MKSDGSFSIGSDTWPGLCKLIEECGELVQVAGKLIALHGGVWHWDGTDLRDRIVEEMGDVNAALRFFLDMNFSDAELHEFHVRTHQKYQLFCLWQNEDQEEK